MIPSAKIRFSALIVLLLALGCVQVSDAAPRPRDTPSQSSAANTAEILSDDAIVAKIETSDGSSLEVTLKQAMQAFDIPGVSIAVIDRDAVAWARGYGVTAPGGATPVTPDTLFQAASISKPVTAAGALWLVERGKLDLDGDVNARLTTWTVPDNPFTAVQKVTLRRLMSHSAGINVPGSLAIHAMGTADAAADPRWPAAGQQCADPRRRDAR